MFQSEFTPIKNYDTPPEAAFQTTHGCAAHDSGQIARETGKICSLFGSGTSLVKRRLLTFYD